VTSEIITVLTMEATVVLGVTSCNVIDYLGAIFSIKENERQQLAIKVNDL
jgi:hypothetical protein